ncbi:hypothetical protein B0H10DRAFT_2110465 [Mycena sp. CBHHK59/15]|nr:hypothetical protein B0H10DRAFT_2110465 [Mycena sp. CBHHK59/15]
MSAPLDALLLSDRPLQTKLLGELKHIGAVMDLDVEQNKAPLLKDIQRHMKEHPELADDPRLTPIFAHRNPPAQGGKTSAGKAAEDGIESAKPPQVATGANKTLIAQNMKTDPPASFTKLGSPVNHKHDKKPDEKPKSEDEGLDSSDDDDVPREIATTPEPDINRGKVENKQQIKGIIHVNFLDELDHQKTLRQVVVDEFPVQLSTTENGGKKYSALLDKLIPTVIKNDSPIKERGGRLYRTNIRDDPQHLHLGRIDAVLDGTASALKPTAVNEYTLRTSEDGTFFCDIYWDQLPASKEKIEGPKEQVEVSQKDEHATGPKEEEMDRPKTFTGAGSDIPLEIANDRAANDPMHKNAPPALREAFARFVHGRVKEAVPDIPDFGDDWTRCNYAGQMRERHVLQEAVDAFMDDSTAKWSLTNGGYRVPRNSTNFAGIKFKKEFLLEEVLNVKTSSTADISRWFSPEMLQNLPEAQAWADTNGKTDDKIFRKMKSSHFKGYLKDPSTFYHQFPKEGSSRGKVRRRRSSSGSRGERPSRKYRRSSRSSREDEEEHSHSSRKFKGGRKETRMTSENLDSR